MFPFKVFSSNLTLQHGGEIGRIAIGYGKSFGIYTPEIFYGYHPEVSTLAIKNNFNVLQYSSFDFDLGFSIFAIDKFQNNNIPDNYYEQSIDKRLYLFYKVRYHHNNLSFFFENGINDVNAEVYYNNDDIPLNDLISLGLGFSFHY